jgi:hypothetical protein
VQDSHIDPAVIWNSRKDDHGLQRGEIRRRSAGSIPEDATLSKWLRSPSFY